MELLERIKCFSQYDKQWRNIFSSLEQQEGRICSLEKNGNLIRSMCAITHSTSVQNVLNNLQANNSFILNNHAIRALYFILNEFDKRIMLHIHSADKPRDIVALITTAQIAVWNLGYILCHPTQVLCLLFYISYGYKHDHPNYNKDSNNDWVDAQRLFMSCCGKAYNWLRPITKEEEAAFLARYVNEEKSKDKWN